MLNFAHPGRPGPPASQPSGPTHRHEDARGFAAEPFPRNQLRPHGVPGSGCMVCSRKAFTRTGIAPSRAEK